MLVSTAIYTILFHLSATYAQQLPPGIPPPGQLNPQQAQFLAQQGQPGPLPFFALQALSQPPQGGAGPQPGQLSLNPTQVNQASLLTGNEGGGKPATPSAQSPNNFINFCESQTLTNGTQNEQGSCNPIPMGSIPAKDKMPSIRVVTPPNLQRIEANQPFDVRLSVRNFIPGSTVNGATNYYSAPQQLGPNGFVIGHLHLTVDRVQRGIQQAPDISAKPAFFKAVDTPADPSGMITVAVDGLPDGEYRVSTLATSSNHAPIALPIAPHGAMDDSIYVFVGSASSLLQSAASAAPGDQARAGSNGASPSTGSTAGQRSGQGSQAPPVSSGAQPQVSSGGQPQVLSTQSLAGGTQLSAQGGQTRLAGAQSSLPAGQSPPPSGQSAPPAGQNASLAVQTPPPGAQNPPPGVQNPPPGAQNPPPGAQTPPPGVQTPPPGVQTPPPGVQTPPPGQQPQTGRQASQERPRKREHLTRRLDSY